MVQMVERVVGSYPAPSQMCVSHISLIQSCSGLQPLHPHSCSVTSPEPFTPSSRLDPLTLPSLPLREQPTARVSVRSLAASPTGGLMLPAWHYISLEELDYSLGKICFSHLQFPSCSESWMPGKSISDWYVNCPGITSLSSSSS